MGGAQAHLVVAERDSLISHLQNQEDRVQMRVYAGWAARFGEKSNLLKIAADPVFAFQVLQHLNKPFLLFQ